MILRSLLVFWGFQRVLENNKDKIVKMTIETVTPLSAYKKTGVSSPLSRNLFCIIVIIVTVIKQGLGNCIDINFYPCDLLYLRFTIYHASNFLCSCVGMIARVRSHASHRKACMNFLTFLSEELSDLLILN